MVGNERSQRRDTDACNWSSCLPLIRLSMSVSQSVLSMIPIPWNYWGSFALSRWTERGHWYWMCLLTVLDTFLNQLSEVSIFPIVDFFGTIFLVFRSLKYICPFVETAYCCHSPSALYIFSVNSDVLHSLNLPQDLHTTASRAEYWIVPYNVHQC